MWILLQDMNSFVSSHKPVSDVESLRNYDRSKLRIKVRIKGKGKGKGVVHSRTGHEGPQGNRGISVISFNFGASWGGC